MTYAVKEIFYTLQGEGTQTGRPAVFCRFAGCNLWTGREDDRAAAICQFCDTEFVGTDGVGGGRFETSEALAQAVARLWPAAGGARRFVVCTGGEPLLQLDDRLVDAFHREGFEVAVETNGTRLPPRGVDWICVSPKAGPSSSSEPGTSSSSSIRRREPTPSSSSSSTSAASSCNRWTGSCASGTPSARFGTAWSTPGGGSASRPTRCSESPDRPQHGDLQGVHF
jgi:7-carboxy-7-deazaguanine synthase (Cx14CxxC type)